MGLQEEAPSSTDPEASGVPGYADDESTAYDEPRGGDGLQPVALPPDREDGPLAIDEFGVTAAEERAGETLDRRLAREEPDTADVEFVHPREEADLVEQPPVDAHLDTAVSMYEWEEIGGGRPVGRLVAPDEGSGVDDEPDAVAEDAGVAGGGVSAEEAAVHEIVDESELSPGEPGDGYLENPR